MWDGVDRRFASPLAGGMLTSPAASIVVAEWTDPGGGHDPPRSIAPLHPHRNEYVLDGALSVRAGRAATLVVHDSEYLGWP